jgi:hypothetical protein
VGAQSLGDIGGDAGSGVSVQRCPAEKVQLGIAGCYPTLEHHPARARHAKPVAVPDRLGRVADEWAVRAVVADELFEVCQQRSVTSNLFIRDGVSEA